MTGNWPADNPRGKARFAVQIHGFDEHHKATRVTVSLATGQRSALTAAARVIDQWAAAEGAIQPGTKLVIVDTRDGGPLFTAQFLGFGVDLFTGR